MKKTNKKGRKVLSNVGNWNAGCHIAFPTGYELKSNFKYLEVNFYAHAHAHA